MWLERWTTSTKRNLFLFFTAMLVVAMCCYGDGVTNGEAKCQIMVLLSLRNSACQLAQDVSPTVHLKCRYKQSRQQRWENKLTEFPWRYFFQNMNPLQLRIKQYLGNSVSSRVLGQRKTAKSARSTQTAVCSVYTNGKVCSVHINGKLCSVYATAKSFWKQRSYFIVSSCPAF